MRHILCAVLMLFPMISCAPSRDYVFADLVVLNGKIRTLSDQHEEVEAVAVRGPRIFAVGRDAELEKLIGPKTQIVDAAGRVVLPGFIDTHMHPRPAFDEMGPFGWLDLRPEGGVTSRATLIEKLRAKLNLTPAGTLVIGFGYNDNLVDGHPAANVLDPLSPDHLVVLLHSSGHRSVANTPAMNAAGITDETPNPPGGEIVRDQSGRATGEFLERIPEMGSLLARLPQADEPATQEAFQREFRMFARHGITSIADAGVTPEKLNQYRSIIADGMPIRIFAMVSDSHLDWLVANRVTSEWASSPIKIDAIKLFHGNSLSGRTAWLYEPYTHDPDYYGIPPGRSQKDLDALVQRIHDAGLQLAIHANGDREIDMVLEAIENAQAHNPRPDPRHRIEHGSVVNARILDRMLAANVSLAPHSYVLNHGEKMEEYGEQRWNWMHANKSALDLGIPVGGNSDHGVSPPNVMERVQSMVTRRARSNGKVYGAAQRVTVHEALWIWTMGSATLQHEEQEKGSLAPGKLADIIILGADPFTADPEALHSITVDITIIGGRVVYDRAKKEAPYAW